MNTQILSYKKRTFHGGRLFETNFLNKGFFSLSLFFFFFFFFPLEVFGPLQLLHMTYSSTTTKHGPDNLVLKS